MTYSSLRLTCRYTLIILTLISTTQPLFANFMPEVTVDTSTTPRAKFSWDFQPSGAVIKVYRRLLGDIGEDKWSLKGMVFRPTTTFVDSDLSIGTTYEYKIERAAFGSNKYTCGYTVVTVNAPLIDSRGAVLLVTDNTHVAELTGELRQMEMDLAGDGWEVVRIDFAPHAIGTPEQLKSTIKKAVASNPNIKDVILFGNLPMVRSGMLKPDGHLPRRAHETDTFYADLNGSWTDTIINVLNDGKGESENIPGDGKYDQSVYPSSLELAVGRVTFHNMPAYRKHEREYLRDYIHKSHAWRHNKRSVPYRGISQVPRGTHMSTAHNWMSLMFGYDNIIFKPLLPETSINAYLWGITDHSGDVPQTSQIRVIFGHHFMSLKQHWWRQNNKIRSLLTQPDWGLSNVWGARPPWYFHHMAAGNPIGYSVLRTQNNYFNGNEYRSTNYKHLRIVSNNFQGDPTLRMHPVDPASNLRIKSGHGNTQLNWSASRQTGLIGYHVYRSINRLGGYTRLTASPIAATSYTDNAVPAGAVYYQVRAITKMTLPTGTYINQSQAAFAWIRDDGTDNTAPIAIPSSFITKTNSPTWIDFQGNDINGDTLTPIVIQNPQNGQLRWYAGQAYYVSYADYIGNDSLTFIMSDGVSVSEPVTITIRVDKVG